MGKFDAEIGKAKKISKDWIATAGEYESIFLSLKKDHLALEKGSLAQIQKAVTAGTADKGDADELAVIKERLEMFKNKGVKEFDAFDKWALKEPRKSMGFIATALKLGDFKSEGYKAVSDATKTQLNDVAAAISQTQRVWRADVLIALDNNMDKIDAVESMLNKEKGKHKALLDQLTKGIARFKDECEKSYNSLKADQFLMMISEINSGKISSLPPTQIEQKCQQAEQRTKVIPQLIAQTDKNYGRIIKSVPDDFIDGFTAAGLKKKLDETYAKSKKDLETAMKICTAVVTKAKEKNLF